MFNKKRCSNCGEKISDSYNFCPYCRKPLKQSGNEDWGMLGKNDFVPGNNEIKMPFGFNALFNTLIKNLDKQFSDLDKSFDSDSKPKFKKSGVSISINTSSGKPPEIKVRKFGGKKKQPGKTKTHTTKRPEKISKPFSKKQKEKFSKLKKEEPKTEIRRLSDKVIYELKMPGVKNEEDIAINQMKESTEIKAIGKKKAYDKIIQVGLPISDYNFSKGVLTLELDAKQ